MPLLKYPWHHRSPDPLNRRADKWGYYEDDRAAFEFAREGWQPEEDDALPKRSFAAELLDWADDLTYAVHDVDDFFRAGLIPLDRLAVVDGVEAKRLAALLLDAKNADPATFPQDYQIDELVEGARRPISLRGPQEPYRHTMESRAEMREFGSTLITDYLEAFTVSDDLAGGMKLRIDPQAKREVEALKMLVRVYVVRRPGLAVVQHGQRRVISDLFCWYFAASSKDKGDRRLFPPGAKERLDKGDDTAGARARVVVDLISGLTETSAIQLHQRLSGGWTAPTLDATAQMG